MKRSTKQGFRVYEVRSVTVVLGQDTNLRVVLEIGNVSETVTVEGSSPLVETTTAQTTATFDNKQIAELPALSGRLEGILNRHKQLQRRIRSQSRRYRQSRN